MLTVFAAALIPLVTVCQMAALALLWRRYRMPGAGWWLATTVLILVTTVGQAIEETGWRPLLLVAAVNAMGPAAAVVELTAARLLTGQTPPSRRMTVVLIGLGVLWGLVAAFQAERHPGLFGLLRSPALATLGVSQTAIALSLFRLSRQGGMSGGYLAATGYLLLVLFLPAYPYSYAHPWLRTWGLANAAFSYLLVGWGMLLFVLDRRQADLLRRAEALTEAAAAQAARAEATERAVSAQRALLDDRSAQAEMGRLAVGLAEDLLATVDDLRQTTHRLQTGPSPAERAALTDRLERTLQDVAQVAAGVLTAGHGSPLQPVQVDCRRLLERLLQDLVPSHVGVMKAWPGPAVWVTTDEALLGVALHQMIRCLVGGDVPVERLSVILDLEDGLSLHLQQALGVRGDAAPPLDRLGLTLADLAVRRLGGSLAVQSGYAGNGLVMRLPPAPPGA